MEEDRRGGRLKRVQDIVLVRHAVSFLKRDHTEEYD